MILGRFPWKVAALSDEAFRLFATAKRPNFHAERGMGRSTTAPPSLQTSTTVAEIPCDLKAANMNTVSMINVALDEAADTKGTERAQEPCRLLSLLPSKSRELVRNMLLLNAHSRPTLEQICHYPWIQQSNLCSQDDSEPIHYGPQHDHVLRHG